MAGRSIKWSSAAAECTYSDLKLFTLLLFLCGREKKKINHKPGQYFTAQYCQGLMSLGASSTAECGLNRKIDSASLLLHRQDSIWNPCIVQKKKNLNGQFADWLERFTEPSAGIPEAIWQRAKRGCWSTERPNRTPTHQLIFSQSSRRCPFEPLLLLINLHYLLPCLFSHSWQPHFITPSPSWWIGYVISHFVRTSKEKRLIRREISGIIYCDWANICKLSRVSI